MKDVALSPAAERWAPRLARWSRRLHAARLDGFVGAVLEVIEPLGPLGAHVLWVAQPTLGMLVPREVVDDLAHVLDEPGGVAWLREQLSCQGSRDDQ